MQPSAYFHESSDAIRFWVAVGDAFVGASVSRLVLHYSFGSDIADADPMHTYVEHAAEIDAAVRRRVGRGSREPVYLREADLRG